MKKPKPTPQRLADLRPQDSIRCLRCDQTQPKAGAMPFRAHWVCAGCAAKLQSTQSMKPEVKT